MIKIRLATKEDQVAWDAYVWNHPQGVAYHQFAWGQAVKNAYRFEPVYLIAEMGSEIVGVFPFIRLKVPLLGSSLVSLPYCDLGGVLANNDSVASELTNFTLSLADRNNDKKVELRRSAQAGEMSGSSKVRMILNLPNSSEELMEGFKAKLRSQVKKPTKDGLMAELGGSELLNDFYQVMAINMRDLGSPVHSRHWFEEVASQYGENSRIGIVRNPDGKAIGGGIILLHNNIVSIPWASTLREHNRQNPNMLLYWKFLSFAADNGFEAFDFGRSTPGEGTYRFKEQWGAKPLPLHWFSLLSDDTQEEKVNSKSNKRKFIEGVWSRMPLTFANFAGSHLRKYISL